MEYLTRRIEKRLHSLCRQFPAIVVTGARQVGKTTLLQHAFPDVREFVVFDPGIDIGNARADPDLFLNNRKTPLILDEIQYAPELVGAIKRRIDKDRSPGQYIMTGSQQWGVLKKMAESLAGRAVFLDLEGFCLAENSLGQTTHTWLECWLTEPERLLSARPRRLERSRSLFEQLWRGWLPETHFLSIDVIPEFYTGYQRTYIERDARLIADISDWQQFGRFFRLVSALTAQEINYSQIGRDIGLTPQTARRWLDVLRSTYQWHDVHPWSGNPLKRVSGKPKGFITDTGIACAALAISSPQAIGDHPSWGALFETAVAGELRKMSYCLSPPPTIYHWRSHGGAEVDFILERDGRLFPVEVKASTHPTRADARGIHAFRKSHKNTRIEKGLVVAPAEEIVQLTEEDWVIPWDLSGVNDL